MSLEKIQKPVIDILWDFKLGYFMEESWVTDSVKGLGKVKGDDDNKRVSAE